jgi:ADP-heptose:LPS heptosyltransferase
MPVRKEEIRRILVLEHECIGDVIMLEPALRALGNFYSGAEIHLLCPPAVKGLAERAGLADRVHAFPAEDPRGEHFDMVFDVHGDIRRIRMMKNYRTRYRCGFQFSGGGAWLTHIAEFPFRLHQVERPFVLLKLLGIPAKADAPRIRNISAGGEGGRCVLLHSGANQEGRRWPEAYWAELTGLLQEAGYEPLWLLPPGESAPGDLRSFSGDLQSVAERIAGAALLIGCDSMAVHLASALSVPALAIFGSQDPRLTRPYGPRGHVISPSVPCRHRRRDWRLCPECMAAVRPAEVAAKAAAILADRGSAV